VLWQKPQPAKLNNRTPTRTFRTSSLHCFNFGSTACETRFGILVKNAGLGHYGEFYASTFGRGI